MATEAYPKDELGMPLPVVIPQPSGPKVRRWNRHHAWYFARRFLSEGTAGSRAVRFSRLQYMPMNLHRRIHKRFEDGVELPKNEYEEFKLTILGLGGYIPAQGIEVSKHKIEPVEISSRQRQILRRPGILRVDDARERGDEIGTFLFDYARRHGLDDVISNEESLVTQFIEEPDSDEAEHRALKIVRAAAEVAVEPLDYFYTEAREAHLLRAHAPRTATRLAMGSIKHDLPDVHRLLQVDLQARLFGIAPPELITVDQQG